MFSCEFLSYAIVSAAVDILLKGELQQPKNGDLEVTKELQAYHMMLTKPDSLDAYHGDQEWVASTT